MTALIIKEIKLMHYLKVCYNKRYYKKQISIEKKSNKNESDF